MKEYKPILCLDFDGVIHSYTSGWKGASKIPDKPVEGALCFIINAINKGFEVNIFSSRSHQWGGIRAMKKWLRHYFIMQCYPDYENMVEPFKSWVGETAFADPWDYEVEYASKRFVNSIKFPKYKPPALVNIDDRCLLFTGKWPMLDELKKFRPWNKPSGN